ncbi:MAG: tetratricopeptide repeat protein, partial [Kiloniellales bacterium]|nr:tetratricopeptide repeat protein [Kiloniellales bacterium]
HLLAHLRPKRMLFLFDSFEHLLDRGALLLDILQAGPGVKILVTSRERLHRRLEQVFPIEGLTFPDKEPAKEAVEYTAVRLFLQSARRIQPNFALNDDNLIYLTQICRMVAGMPLALELAASWVDVLSLDEIASELKQGLDILETELRDVPERQRSVQASFDCSWRKLDDTEQTIFAQLSIFRGGFTRAAAAGVTGASLRQLSRLVNKSLIAVDKQRHRYSVHNLLRQYGADKLGQQPILEAATYDRHSDYYCRLMAGYTNDLKSAGQARALSAINADLKNVQQAWDHASSQHNFEAIDMAIESLWRFYWNFGRRDVKEFEKAVAELRTGEASGARGIVLGRILAPLGRFYQSRGNTVKATETLEESLDLLQRLGTAEESLLPLLFLAEVQESIEESNRLYEEGLALAKKFDDPWAIGHALLYLGWNALELGDYQRAVLFTREALDQFKRNGDKGGIAFLLSQSGLLAIDQGRYEDALAFARESISVTQEVNPDFGWGWWVQALALFALGEYEEAAEKFRYMLPINQERGNKYQVYGALFWLGEIAFNTGDYSQAAQQYQDSLAGAVEDKNLAFIVQNHNALGRLDGLQGRIIEARRHFLTALQTAISFGRPPLILDCLVSVAELFVKEGDLDSAALLALFISEHPASRAKTKERADRLLARTEKYLPSDEMAAVHQRSEQSDLKAVADQLLLDLEKA